MANELKTRFVYDDGDNQKIDGTIAKLREADSLANKLRGQQSGVNPTFGNFNFDPTNVKDAKDYLAIQAKILQNEKAQEAARRATAAADREVAKLQKETRPAVISKEDKDIAASRARAVAAINAQTEKNARDQANLRLAITKRTIDAEINEEKRLDKYRQQSSRDFAARNNSESGGNGGSGFGDSFASRTVGSDFGSAAFLGGLAGGAVVAGVGLVKDAVSALVGEVKDLSVESIRLAANFEQTTNSLAVFAGSTSEAKRELADIDKVALNTPGLRLQDAEVGYQRLRALGFQAKISQDLIKGLGTQRVLSGASSDAVDRVITNLIQLQTGAGTAADVRQTIGQLPTLLPVFKKAFGTQDFGDINKIFKTDPQALQKFSNELAKAQTAQAGLNVTIEKGADALIQAGRVFGEPFLQPLTRDTKDLTELLRENESTVRKWGQSLADAYNGVSRLAKSGGSPGVGDALIGVGRGLLSAGTSGISEGIIGSFNLAEYFGKQAREAEEVARQQGVKVGVSFTDAFAGQYTIDPLTNTLKLVGETIKDTPNLQEQIRAEEADKEAKELKKTLTEVAALPLKFALDDVSQNLEINKAIAVRDARGDGLKLARQTAELEINALKEQIALSDKIALNKIRNLSPEDLASGKGLLISRENDQNLAKLESQITLTRINAQKQQNDEIEKAKSKAADLAKTYRDTFTNLTQKANADNPFVTVFTDADKALRELRVNIKGLKPEMQSAAVALQQAINKKTLYSTALDNQLNAFDLRDQAQNFRNPFDGEKQKKEQQDFIERFLRSNPNYLFTQGKNTLDDEKRARILKQFAPSSFSETAADRLNKSLTEKADLLYKPRQTPQEQEAADRRFIALTQGTNPLDLSQDNRERAAAARERQAKQTDDFQRNALEIYTAMDAKLGTVLKGLASGALRPNVILNGVNADVEDLSAGLPDRPQGGAKTKDADYGSPEFFQNAFNSFK